MVSLAALRRFVVAHQAYTTRFRRASGDDIEAAIRRLSCVQLDSISTVDRSHRIALASRVGAFAPPVVSTLLEEGRIFEYWAHEACLVPIEDFALFKHRMDVYRVHPWRGNVIEREPELAERVLSEIRARGPLASRQFEGRGQPGEMWGWKPAKVMLEALFAAGELVVARRDGFQRLYDLPERVIPRALLAAPTPSEEEFRRSYALRAVEGRGALTEYGINEHCRFRGGTRAIRPALEALMAEGRLRRVAVDDGGPPVYVPAEAELDCSPPPGGVLLSPFDNLLWDRPFAERLFGFRHLIEVYKRDGERRFGYYVLPFLLGDRLVGRADLKSERGKGILRVRALHLEPKVRPSARLDDAFEGAALRLARTIGLERVER